VDNFDEMLQQIFRLKLFAEYTFLEISKILEMPESTVKTKYYSIIRKIKKYVRSRRWKKKSSV
ncbi:hypothetical protein Z962_12295, partial [Clostridium botulinum C/D str. BKT12695]